MVLLIFIQNLNLIIIVAFLFSIGTSLSSGNLSSIVFKNLNYLKTEKSYFFTLSYKSMLISLISSGVASIIGGYLGVIDYKIPFNYGYFFLIINLIVISFFLIEFNINYTPKNFKNNQLYKDFYTILLEGFKLSINSNQIIFILIFSALLFSLSRVGFNFYQPKFLYIEMEDILKKKMSGILK